MVEFIDNNYGSEEYDKQDYGYKAFLRLAGGAEEKISTARFMPASGRPIHQLNGYSLICIAWHQLFSGNK